ncbi:MAG: VTT domain-containing protein [Pseudomonadota bacterium]|nr:VTT domain-containing protein [Pseudomonadota bacterium]
MAVLGQNWSLGLLIIAGLIFVETGLVLMPFLPGDTLLFAAGAFLAVTGRSPPILIATASLAAIAGDTANYSIGRSAIGQQIVRRRWVKPRHMEQAERWFDRFGGSTVMIGRFVPIVRTIAPFMAGLAGMRAKRFFAFNIVGGVAWCTLLVEGGFWLGHVDWLRNHLQWFSLGIAVVSLLPVMIQFLRAGQHSETANR